MKSNLLTISVSGLALVFRESSLMPVCFVYLERDCLTHKQSSWSFTLWKSHPWVNNLTNTYHCLSCSKHLCCRSVNTDFQVCVEGTQVLS